MLGVPPAHWPPAGTAGGNTLGVIRGKIWVPSNLSEIFSCSKKHQALTNVTVLPICRGTHGIIVVICVYYNST